LREQKVGISDSKAELEWEITLFESDDLCFSVYSAHSHYEILHNVEALGRKVGRKTLGGN